jgi:hypothetical protein
VVLLLLVHGKAVDAGGNQLTANLGIHRSNQDVGDACKGRVHVLSSAGRGPGRSNSAGPACHLTLAAHVLSPRLDKVPESEIGPSHYDGVIRGKRLSKLPADLRRLSID